jgi:regulatory protein
MMQVQKLTPQQALPKLQQYCAYQERCHKEVQDKLHAYGVFGQDADAIVSHLIEHNYLNEERFAIQFAGGRFRMKQWGRLKITFELKKKQVSPYCIKKALQQIEEQAYQQTFFTLADKKTASLKGEKNVFVKKKKLRDYLVLKGYENQLIQEAVNNC